MADLDFRLIKQALTIDRVAELLGLTLKKKGEKQFKAACPIKGTRDALIITPDYPNKDGTYGRFHCFSCKEGGDAIQLAAKVNKCEQKEAARYLQGFTQPALPLSKPERDFSKVIEYLQPAHPLLAALKLEEDTCKHFKCGYKPKGTLSGRLAIPVHDIDGKHAGYCGRAVKPSQEPLFIWSSDLDGDGKIFNIAAIQAGTVYCTDDPLSVMLAWQHGIDAIATFGPPSTKTLRVLAELMDKAGATTLENL